MGVHAAFTALIVALVATGIALSSNRADIPDRGLIVGPPAGVDDWRRDTRGDGTACAAGNPGYRCFSRAHRSRPPVLVQSTEAGGVRVLAAADLRELYAHSPSCPDGKQTRAPGAPVARAVAHDLFIPTSGSPGGEWRTVAVAGTCRGLLALDLTEAPPRALWQLPTGERPGPRPFPAAALGRIRSGEGGRAVAIFGGGSPTRPENSRHHHSGRVLVADAATGRTLAERRLGGTVRGRPSAVDLDGDGLLDRVYVGTDLGYLYRLDLSPTGLLGQPQLLFDANGGEPGRLRSLAHGPAVLATSSPGEYALAFGTDAQGPETGAESEGRFFLLVDDSDRLAAAALPLTESALVQLDERSGNLTTDSLTDRPPGRRGWSLALAPGERVLSAPVSLAGATFFTTHRPSPAGGASRVFALDTTNGNALLKDPAGASRRALPSPVPLGPPFAAPSRDLGSPGQGARRPLLGPESELSRELQRLLPPECRFGEFHVDVRATTTEGGEVLIARIPVCLIEQHWKEL